MRKFIVTVLFILIASTCFCLDSRPQKIHNFLVAKFSDSPLIGHEQELVYCADKFNLDYRLYLAISAAESTFGRSYRKSTNNLTGISNGVTKFDSIYDNIYKTNELISTGKWYWKYRKTRKLEDLVYVYKGVPPYKHYVFTLNWVFEQLK